MVFQHYLGLARLQDGQKESLPKAHKALEKNQSTALSLILGELQIFHLTQKTFLSVNFQVIRAKI